MVRAKANRGGEATFKAIGAGQAVCGRVFDLSRLTGGWLGSRVTAWALALVLLAPALCPAQFSGPDAAPGPFVPAQPGALDFSQTNQPVTDQVIAARAAAAAQLAAATNAALGTARGAGPQLVSASGGRPVSPPAQWVRGADGGFSASNALFEATLGSSLDATGCLSVSFPGGEPAAPLRGSILALAYYEPGPEGRCVTIGQVQPSSGEVMGKTRVIFRDAFQGEGVAADVVYELSTYSVIQNVLIRGRLPGPEDFGLSEDSTLTVITEFYDPPAPSEQPATDGSEDFTLAWGPMRMVHGKAFSLGAPDDGSSVDVNKTWGQTADGRWLLLESVAHQKVKTQLNALPVVAPAGPDDSTDPGPQPPHQGSLGPGKPSEGLLAWANDRLSPLPLKASWSPVCPLAPMGEDCGYVIDYVLTLIAPIINIDFASGGTEKSGLAAVGQSGSDIWNTYSLLGDGTLAGLQWSDGGPNKTNNSGASVSVTNAPGNWSFTCCMPSIDPMYDAYLYPNSGSISVTLKSLPAGTYHFYIYGHGPAQNANTVFTLAGNVLSTSSTGNFWNSADWREGEQYVVFRNVTVTSGQPVSFTAGVGASGYAVLNGMQIVPASAVPPPPTISIQPQDATVGVGGSATFSVSASGSGPLGYQWRKSGVNISGATASSYSIVGVQSSDAATYSVVVSNPGGAVNSREATLTVTTAACLTPPLGLVAWWPGDNSTSDLGRGHPIGLYSGCGYISAVVGSGFNFNGSGAYGMVVGTPDLDVGAGAGLTFEAWIKPQDNSYRPLCEWDTSSRYGAEFWANYPGPGQLYANLVDTSGGSHTVTANNVLTVGAQVHVALTYNKSTGVARLFVNGVKQAESALGSFTPQTSLDFYLGYRAQGLSWGGACFNGFIDEPTLYDHALDPAEISAIYSAGSQGKCKGGPPPSAPVITSAPQSQTVNLNSPVSFTVSASGTAPLSYQWYKNGSSISGATGASLTVSSVQGADAAGYKVTVSNPGGSVSSGDANLAVITSQPQGQTVNQNGTATFSVAVSSGQ